MDIENEKIGQAYKAPNTYFIDAEMRLLQRLGIRFEKEVLNDNNTASGNEVSSEVGKSSINTLDTTGVQKRARKQDPVTLKSVAVNREDDSVKVIIPSLTITTNENPEWVNFGAIADEVSNTSDSLSKDIKLVSYVNSDSVTHDYAAGAEELYNESEIIDDAQSVITKHKENQDSAETVFSPISTTGPVLHEVPVSIGLDELESYITKNNSSDEKKTDSRPVEKSEFEINEVLQFGSSKGSLEFEEKPIILDAPPTAFAPIAGRQRETATPGWLGVAAALAAVIAAYFIWTAIQPPKINTEEVALQAEEGTYVELPLDEQISADTIPDGLQIVEPLILEEMPKYKEPNIYTIIDAEEMPERTKVAVQDLEDHGLATFDMEDELFEELDFESL